MMRQNTVQNSLRSSIAIVRSIRELPSLSAIEVKVLPHRQKAEAFFSDARHLTSVTGGQLAGSTQQVNGSRLEAQLSTRLTTGQTAPVLGWLANHKLESPVVAFQGADLYRAVFELRANRTFLPSTLENDLKYRLGFQEFHMDRAAVRLAFVFNRGSAKQARAREAFLRLNYLPVRRLKRRVNNV